MQQVSSGFVIKNKTGGEGQSKREREKDRSLLSISVVVSDLIRDAIFSSFSRQEMNKLAQSTSLGIAWTKSSRCQLGAIDVSTSPSSLFTLCPRLRKRFARLTTNSIVVPSGALINCHEVTLSGNRRLSLLRDFFSRRRLPSLQLTIRSCLDANFFCKL